MPARIISWLHRRHMRLSMLLFLLLGSALSGCFGHGQDYCGVAPPQTFPYFATDNGLHFAANNGLLFYGALSAGSFYAVNASDGSVRWKYSSPYFNYQVADGIVFFQTSNATYALREGDGKELWHYPANDQLHILHGIIYISHESATAWHLVALRESDGTMLWQTDRPSPPQFMLAEDSIVYIGEKNATIVALREDSGSIVWQKTAVMSIKYPRFVGLHSMVMQNGLLFASSDQTYALRASDGKQLWTHSDAGKLIIENGTLYSGNLLLHYSGGVQTPPDKAYRVDALRASDGKQLWTTSFPPNNFESQSAEPYSIWLEHGILFTGINLLQNFMSGDTVVDIAALNAHTGALLWNRSFGDSNQLATVDGQSIYAFSDKGVLDVLNVSDGSSRWQSSASWGGAFEANGSVYVGTAGNNYQACYPPATSTLASLQNNSGAQLWKVDLPTVSGPKLQ